MPKRQRSTPYTTRGIKRVPCQRCGAPSRFQWNVCSLGGGYYGVCADCDVLLNHLTLRFFQFGNHEALIAKYAEEVHAG